VEGRAYTFTKKTDRDVVSENVFGQDADHFTAEFNRIAGEATNAGVTDSIPIPILNRKRAIRLVDD
jgi:hypothetical protein